MDPNFIGIALAVFFGLAGIGVAIFFGLRGFGKDIKLELSAIKEKVIVIQETVQNVWDMIRSSRIFAQLGTVERELRNLGKVTITAEPHVDSTIYVLSVQKPIFDGERIYELTKSTEFERREKEMFGGNVTKIRTPVPTRMIITVPSTEPNLCAKYMSLFLKWLDSAYIGSLPRVADFEEQIQV